MNSRILYLLLTLLAVLAISCSSKSSNSNKVDCSFKVKNTTSQYKLCDSNKSWNGLLDPIHIHEELTKTEAWHNNILFFDIDNDNYKDLITHHEFISNGSTHIPDYTSYIRFYKSISSQTFTLKNKQEVASDTSLTDIGYINSSTTIGSIFKNKIQLVINKFWSNGLYIHELDQNFLFNPSGYFYTTGTHGGEGYLVDYDKDGKNDLVAVSNGSRAPLFAHFFQASSGTSLLKEYTSTASFSNGYYHSFHILDIKNDGNLDYMVDEVNYVSFLKIANNNQISSNEWYEIKSCANEQVDCSYSFFSTANNSSNLIMRAAYMDETKDLLHVKHYIVDENTDNPNLKATISINIPAGNASSFRYSGVIKSLDINADGYIDLLWVQKNEDNYELVYLLGNGEYSFEATPVILDTFSKDILQYAYVHDNYGSLAGKDTGAIDTQINVSDLNNDGFLDIAFVYSKKTESSSYSSHNIKIYLSR